MSDVAQQNAADYLRLWQKLARIRALCDERAAAEARHGEAGAAIWPEELLAILDGDVSPPR